MGVEHMPIVRIEIERMKYAIATMLSEHHVKMDQETNAALEQAVKNFDYANEVHKITYDVIKDALRRAIEEQFRYGGHGYESIQAVCRKLVADAMAGMTK